MQGAIAERRGGRKGKYSEQYVKATVDCWLNDMIIP